MRKIVSAEPTSQHNPALGLPFIFGTFSAASPTKFSIAISVALRTDKQVKVTMINAVLRNIKHRETLTKSLRFWTL